MTILSKHIFKEFITLVAGVLAGIIVVYLCIEFLQKADRLIKYHATLLQVTLYFLYSIPNMISLSLPMATLIASLLSLGNLSRHNEIIAMRASGVSLARIIMPMLFGGVLLSGLGFLNTEYVIPVYSSRADYVRNVEIEKKPQRVMFQQHKLWLRGPDNSIANIDLVSPNRNEMIGLNIYKLNPDYSVRERIKAGSLLWENGNWRLKHSLSYTFDNDDIHFHNSDNEIFNIVENPNDLGMIVKDSQEMNFQELWDYVKRLKSSGYKAASYEVDLYNKIAFPFSSLLVVMLSIPFSIHKVRSSGAGKGIAIAVVIAFFYWTLWSVGGSLGRSGMLPPMVAAWFANIIFGAAAIIVLARIQKTS
jgi:lipopolysaccharide export system permease protein